MTITTTDIANMARQRGVPFSEMQHRWDEIQLSLADLPDSNRTEHYDIAGQPISFAEWAMRFEYDFDYRVVQHDQTPAETLVSTVWMGLDPGWGAGPPVIFETMTFPKHGEDGQWRWHNYRDAKLAHHFILNRTVARESIIGYVFIALLIIVAIVAAIALT